MLAAKTIALALTSIDVSDSFIFKHFCISSLSKNVNSLVYNIMSKYATEYKSSIYLGAKSLRARGAAYKVVY